MASYRNIGRVFMLLAFASALTVAQNSSGNFDQFYSSFKTAVAQKNEAVLTKMMAPQFGFLRAENVAPAEVFQALASNGGQQWANLQSAVQQQQQPTVYQAKSKLPTRVLNCTPDQTIYNCLGFSRTGNINGIGREWSCRHDDVTPSAELVLATRNQRVRD